MHGSRILFAAVTVNPVTAVTAEPVSPAADAADSAGVKLELLTSYCESSSCPTIYRTDRGTLVVQGYVLSAQRAGVEVPEGESLVEIPAELLAAAAQAVS